MLIQKGGEKLLNLDKKCTEIGAKWRSLEKEAFCTSEELFNIIEWKFSVGKPRPLWKQIKSNSEDDIKQFSKDAFSLICDTNKDDENLNKVLAGAIENITKLKGIGPAAASAMLSLYRPDLMVFMYDEVLDCLLGERKYTVTSYFNINDVCMDICKSLGTDNSLWNARKIGNTLWSAARLSLCKDRIDLTLSETNSCTKTKIQENRVQTNTKKQCRSSSTTDNQEQNAKQSLKRRKKT